MATRRTAAPKTAARASEPGMGGLLAFTEIGTNRDTQLLKLIALICMIIDHSGKMLFPHYGILRIIGRLAFPIYAYCVAVGCVYTRDPIAYLKRLVLLALISQPIYAVAMAHTTPAMFSVPFAENPFLSVLNFYVESWHHPNIFCTLAMGVLICSCLKRGHAVLVLALALLTWKLNGSLDYGWKGVALIVLFFITCRRWWISLPVVLAFMLWWAMQGTSYQLFGYSFGIQLFACAALPLVYIHMDSHLRVNKWVFYWLYPAHLVLIYVLDKYVM